MDSIEFPAYVEVSVTPKTGKAVACWVGAALTAVIAVAGIALGLTVSVFVFLLVFYLLRASKGAQGSRELKVVQARLTVAGGQLELDLPASRLFDGRYVEQRYFADCSRGCSVELGEKGGLVFRAADLVSDAVENGGILDHREHEGGEVTLTVVSDEAKHNLRGFLERNCL